jgi:hypothetical protein
MCRKRLMHDDMNEPLYVGKDRGLVLQSSMNFGILVDV